MSKIGGHDSELVIYRKAFECTTNTWEEVDSLGVTRHHEDPSVNFESPIHAHNPNGARMQYAQSWGVAYRDVRARRMSSADLIQDTSRIPKELKRHLALYNKLLEFLELTSLFSLEYKKNSRPLFSYIMQITEMLERGERLSVLRSKPCSIYEACMEHRLMTAERVSVNGKTKYTLTDEGMRALRDLIPHRRPHVEKQ